MQQRPRVLRLRDVQVEKITYGNPIRLQTSDVIIPIGYDGPLFIQIPELHLSEFAEENVLVLPLVGPNEKITKETVSKLKALDARVIADLKTIIQKVRLTSTAASAKKFSYDPIVYVMEDGGDALKLNLADVRIYNEKRELMVGSDINQFVGSLITCLLELSAVCIRDNEVHVSIRPHQLKIAQPDIPSYRLEEYSFIDSDSDSGENSLPLNSMPPSKKQTSPISQPRPTKRVMTESEDSVDEIKKNNLELIDHLDDRDEDGSGSESELDETDIKKYFERMRQ